MRKYELERPDNLVEMFEESRKKYANNIWLGTKSGEEYSWLTYREVGQRIDNLRAGLAQIGVNKGDTVSLIANNRVEWAECCYATYGRCAKFVPMYEAELPKIWKYIVSDSGAKVLFVSTDDIYERVKGFVDEIESLEKIIRLEGKGEGTLKGLESLGREHPVEATIPGPDDIAGLIYTSGTTGDPKGVLLSHGNLSSNVHAVTKAYPIIGENTKTLSFLPWAHSYGQTAELHTLMKLGASTGFAESPQTIVDDLALLKPTMLVAVPRIFNRVYDGLQKKMNEKGGLAKRLFEMGLAAAEKRRELADQGKFPDILTKVRYAIADRIVFSKIREKFGNRMELAVSSSAALNPDIAYFFHDIGIPIFDAWGMTELSPAGTLNTPLSFKIGSAGKAIDKVELVIDKSVSEEGARDGELIVYGPNVMQGYHNKPEQTKATMTEDGGLRTGDRAYLDDDGFLFITGRIKEQYKLNNGKFVFPAALEEEIKLLPEVEHAMVYGLNRPFNVCLVVPDFAILDGLAEKNNWPKKHDEMVNDSRVKEMIEAKISAHLKDKFGGYEIPKKYILLSEQFSTENGILTPTLKLKRRVVVDKYGEEIEGLYRE